VIPRAAKVRNDRVWPLEDALAEGFKDPTLEGLGRRPLACALVDAADTSLDMLPSRPFSDTPLPGLSDTTPLLESPRCPPCPDTIQVDPSDSRPTANDDDKEEDEEEEKEEEEEDGR